MSIPRSPQHGALALAALLALAHRSAAEEQELSECPGGDIPCLLQTAHRLFDDGEHREAVEYYEKAGNNANALDGLGFAYETGQGKPKDPAKAFSLYTEAASVKCGYDLAEFHLGNCYA